MSCKTFTYKHLGALPLQLDLYPPASEGNRGVAVPAVIYFHAGGLTIGDRKDWFPNWLRRQ